jgi:hypothetical protein
MIAPSTPAHARDRARTKGRAGGFCGLEAHARLHTRTSRSVAHRSLHSRHSHLGPSLRRTIPTCASEGRPGATRCGLADPRILWAESAAARSRRNGGDRKPHARVHAHRRGENAHAAVPRDFQGAVPARLSSGQARLGAAQARLEVKAESRPFQAFRVGPHVAEWPPDCLVPQKGLFKS